MATSPHHATTQTRTVDEHTHGTAEIRAHERTFHGFVRLAAWSAAISIAVLIFLALTNA